MAHSTRASRHDTCTLLSSLSLVLLRCIPFTDPTFVKSTEHVIKLVGEMRNQVNISRIKLMSEVQGDAGASDCLIWRNASKEYKREARELDDQMRELILLSKVTKRMLKEVINVCRRGARQDMYAESASSMRQILQGALISRTSSKGHIDLFRKKLHKQGGSSPPEEKGQQRGVVRTRWLWH